MQFAIALTVLSGCDAVWGLVRDPEVDATPIDTPMGCTAAEHDEDGDLIPDRCDNCPAVANNPQGADLDQDGVGDVCDPQINKFSPRVRFMAFDALPPDLALTPAGVWTIDKDTLVVGPTAASADYIATYDTMSPNVVIRARAKLVTAPPPVIGSHSFGLWAEVKLEDPPRVFPTGTVFELIDTGTRSAHLVETQQPDPPMPAMTASDPMLFMEGRIYDVQMLCTTAQPVCIATVADPPNLLKFTDPSKDAHARIGAVGLRIHGDVTVAFDYLEVFEAAP